MRRKRPARRKTDDDDRVLPLINIVFLLLIFFMVVGRLSAADPFEILPPRSASDGAPATEGFLVSIGAEGELALNGVLVSEADLLAQIEEAEGGDLRIKSDGRASAPAVVALLEKLRIAGIKTVRLMTVPKMDDGS